MVKMQICDTPPSEIHPQLRESLEQSPRGLHRGAYGINEAKEQSANLTEAVLGVNHFFKKKEKPLYWSAFFRTTRSGFTFSHHTCLRVRNIVQRSCGIGDLSTESTLNEKDAGS